MDIDLIKDSHIDTCKVQIRYPVMNAQVQNLIEKIKNIDTKLSVNYDNNTVLVDVSDVFYIESLERKTFVYTTDSVYRSSKKMYQLLDELTDHGFVQINKSCVLNMNVLISVKVLFNSRLEALLINDEKVIISRRYIAAVKNWLETRHV